MTDPPLHDRAARPLLTILSDPARAAVYEALARGAGVEVLHAEGALHALTRLERTPVAAIMCDAEMEDMSGEEFREVVAAEQHSRDVPVYVVPTRHEVGGPGEGHSGLHPLTSVLRGLGVRDEALPAPLQPGASAHLQGDLSQFNLPEFLNWVAEMRFSGHWLVTVAGDPAGTPGLLGHLVMRAGQLIYAECCGAGSNGHTGKAALFALLRRAERRQDATFRFYRTDLATDIRSPDLDQPTPRLLMELAVELDHYAAAHTSAGALH
ncbi:protein of unknown function [Deinococcus reticulitermitis]|uniref:PatA-like N-terminal domain-containing protein n=1 Tax=Deinococcus reticulitermitis TaxID=856736 RepID=A0A1H6YBF9_9DEIO|nr:DUF4388 domain-containing protein [Deinococcus reticulitermitis]SEJ34490.1 protein of unknown function [Deinococcus reticulitermitis]